MFSGPYSDPVDNLAHSALTNAGKTNDSKPDKELDDKINKFNAQTDEKVADVIKGKTSAPPAPKAPKPEAWMYQKTPSYKMAHDARK